MDRKLKRVEGEEWIGGVCAGLAYWLGFPVWAIRLILTLFVLVLGIGFIPYVLLWIFLPVWEVTPADYKEVAE